MPMITRMLLLPHKILLHLLRFFQLIQRHRGQLFIGEQHVHLLATGTTAHADLTMFAALRLWNDVVAIEFVYFFAAEFAGL